MRRRSSATASSAPTIASCSRASASAARATRLKRGFARLTNVEIKTLCDPDANLAPERINDERLKDVASFKPGFVQDLRRALDDKDIDAIVIAAPNHWHALATVWGLQAGKHVFVEKPASHTVMEGRWMIDAAARYKKLVQVGTMNRSRPPCARRSSSSTTAASARSTWRADCASSRVRRSANIPTARWRPARSTRSPSARRTTNRPTTSSTCRRSITTSGSVRRRSARSIATGSTTTGTGIGTTATATPATRARTSSTPRDGD